MSKTQDRAKRLPYARESLMYPDVLTWLRQFLEERYPRGKVYVADTSQQPLYRFLRQQVDTSLIATSLLPADWQSWDIRVNIAGLVIHRRSLKLAIVECKIRPITLTHMSQLLGYSRVVQPDYAFLLSPTGATSPLQKLLRTYNRQDILNYRATPGSQPRSLIIARWDAASKTPDRSAIITGDDNITRI